MTGQAMGWAARLPRVRVGRARRRGRSAADPSTLKSQGCQSGRFLLEAEQVGIGSLDELNDRFGAWVARYLDVRVHTGTGESPAARYARGTVRQADPELIRPPRATVSAVGKL